MKSKTNALTQFSKWLSVGLLFFTVYSCTPKQEKDMIVEYPSNGAFLNFTDLHFNPYYDTTLIPQLVQEDYTKWDSIFSTSEITDYGTYGEEANYPLFSNALKSMKKNNPNPDFMLMAGDFICHDFGARYQKHTKEMQNEAVHAFLEKTIQFIALKIKDSFNEVAVFPALGNNDSYCGDYQIEAQGKFLKMFANLWYPYISKYDSVPNFFHDFEEGGHYVATNPKNPKHKFVVLNSIFFSRNYKSSKYAEYCDCDIPESGYDSLGLKELQWFDKVLANCKANDETVWVITHIPPGIDVYSTMSGKGDCDENVVPYWNPIFTEKYKEIINKYSSTIKTTMVGHTHMDDFKVIYNSDSPSSFVHISPAVTPVFGNNPGYQTISYDMKSSNFTNYETFYVDYAKPTPQWSAEYNFEDEYGYQSITPLTLDSLFKRMQTDSVVLNKYMNRFPVQSKHGSFVDNQNWPWYRCGINHILNSKYVDCSCK